MAVNEKSHRIQFRRDLAVFQVSFYEDAARTIPATPIDIGQYPAYTIYDTHNVAVQSGIGQPISTPGTYKVEFLVPADAHLSYEEKRWRIEWMLVNTDNRQFDFIEAFDVRDEVITASENREQKYITLCDRPYRALWRTTKRPHELVLTIYQGTSNTIVEQSSLNVGISFAHEGDSVVFYRDVPQGTLRANQKYSLIWEERDDQFSVPEFTFMGLTSITPSLFSQVTSVRMLIDKFQKRLNTVQAYEDSDIVEYIEQGTALVNAGYPTTFYPLGATPQPLNVFVILMSAWWGLQAQNLLEVDLAFNFSGQTVTLDYDHTSALADVAGRWNDFISTNLPPAKMAIVRASQPFGVTAGRAYRNSSQFLTYKVASFNGANGFSSDNYLSIMTRMGLLW